MSVRLILSNLPDPGIAPKLPLFTLGVDSWLRRVVAWQATSFQQRNCCGDRNSVWGTSRQSNRGIDEVEESPSSAVRGPGFKVSQGEARSFFGRKQCVAAGSPRRSDALIFIQLKVRRANPSFGMEVSLSRALAEVGECWPRKGMVVRQHYAHV